MKTMSIDETVYVSGGALPAVLAYAAVKKVAAAGAKKYAKKTAKRVSQGAVGGATTRVLNGDD